MTIATETRMEVKLDNADLSIDRKTSPKLDVRPEKLGCFEVWAFEVENGVSKTGSGKKLGDIPSFLAERMIDKIDPFGDWSVEWCWRTERTVGVNLCFPEFILPPNSEVHRIRVVGVTFEGRQQWMEHFAQCNPTQVSIRPVDNPHDRWAVGLFCMCNCTQQWVHIGFVKRGEASKIRRLATEKKQQAEITIDHKEGNWGATVTALFW